MALVWPLGTCCVVLCLPQNHDGTGARHGRVVQYFCCTEPSTAARGAGLYRDHSAQGVPASAGCRAASALCDGGLRDVHLCMVLCRFYYSAQLYDGKALKGECLEHVSARTASECLVVLLHVSHVS